MRNPLFVVAVLLATAAGARSQTPIKVISNPTPPPTTPIPAAPLAPAANRVPTLDDHLASWETKMRDVRSLEATINRIDKNKNFGTTSKFSGAAQYAKFGTGPTALNKAALELKQEGKADFSEKIVCTGTYLYQFLPSQKEIRAYAIAKSKPGQVGEDSFLGFLFGMKAQEAKNQFNLTLFKVDANYVYIDVSPRTAAGKADFTRARMVLDKATYMPRQLWFEEANGNEVTWDIPRIVPGASIDARVFDTPRTPAGWKLVPVATTAAGTSPAPRVIRK